MQTKYSKPIIVSAIFLVGMLGISYAKTLKKPADPHTAVSIQNFSALGIVSDIASTSLSMSDETNSDGSDATTYTFGLASLENIQDEEYNPLTIDQINIGDEVVVQGIEEAGDITIQRIISFATTTAVAATTTDAVATSTATSTIDSIASSTDSVASTTESTSTPADATSTADVNDTASSTSDISTSTDSIASTTPGTATSTDTIETPTTSNPNATTTATTTDSNSNSSIATTTTATSTTSAPNTGVSDLAS